MKKNRISHAALILLCCFMAVIAVYATKQEVFVEDFEGDVSLWIRSEVTKLENKEKTSKFDGEWAIELPTVLVSEASKKGLVVKSPAKHHAISARFAHPIDTNDKDLVIQYEVKFQNNLECGGAYLKLLTYDAQFNSKYFDDKTPYTIMFGPDKCGVTNKIHFIFRHRNPKTGEIEEKHLKDAPMAVINKRSNLYTLVVKPDNSFEIFVNEESVKTGSLLENFHPSVNPSKLIDDPDDIKPADWIDEARIPDLKANKPVDWDENAPQEIPDLDVIRPDDWLENESEFIPDPNAKKPADWDDEMDGEWSPVNIPNPKCVGRSGCGSWKRPMKRNPNYKGKWTPPLIDNPKYQGEWKPRQIDNPSYFEDLHPHNFGSIGAIGFELWTLQDGIMFTNIYVGHDLEAAKQFAKKSWSAKFEAEKTLESHEKEAEKIILDEKDTASMNLEGVKSMLNLARRELEGFIDRFKRDPIQVAKTEPTMLLGFIGLGILPLLVLMIILNMFKPKKSVPAINKMAPINTKTNLPRKVNTLNETNNNSKTAHSEDEDENSMESEDSEEIKVTKRVGRAKKYAD